MLPRRPSPITPALDDVADRRGVGPSRRTHPTNLRPTRAYTWTGSNRPPTVSADAPGTRPPLPLARVGTGEHGAATRTWGGVWDPHGPVAFRAAGARVARRSVRDLDGTGAVGEGAHVGGATRRSLSPTPPPPHPAPAAPRPRRTPPPPHPAPAAPRPCRTPALPHPALPHPGSASPGSASPGSASPLTRPLLPHEPHMPLCHLRGIDTPS